jgi:hypothetical protein
VSRVPRIGLVLHHRRDCSRRVLLGPEPLRLELPLMRRELAELLPEGLRRPLDDGTGPAARQGRGNGASSGAGS